MSDENAMRQRRWRGGRPRDPNVARSLQPGVTGFLFTINPKHADKARRETLALLGHYTDLVLGDDTAADGQPLSADADGKRHRAEGQDIASALATELGNKDNGEQGDRREKRGKWQAHPLLRAVDTKVRGFLFISVSQPPSEDGDEATPEADVAPPSSDPPGDEGQTVDEKAGTADEAGANGGPRTVDRHELRPENALVSAIADAMWDDLVANPRPVARFTFRCYPVPVSTLPTRPDLIAQAALGCAVSWRKETLLDDSEDPTSTAAVRAFRTAPVAAWCTVTVRNNTNIDREKAAIQAAVGSALAGNAGGGFLVQPYFTSKGSELICKERPTLMVSVMVVHSVALVGVLPSYPNRQQYNLGTISEGALKLNNLVQHNPPASETGEPPKKDGDTA